MDYKNILKRAGWTFLQAFLAVLLVSTDNLVELLFKGDIETLMVAGLAVLIGAISAGLSALKTVILELVEEKKNGTTA